MNARARRRGSVRTKNGPDREQQLVEPALPPAQVYASPSGHCTMVMSLHEPR
jgi:hypothetical protein